MSASATASNPCSPTSGDPLPDSPRMAETPSPSNPLKRHRLTFGSTTGVELQLPPSQSPPLPPLATPLLTHPSSPADDLPIPVAGSALHTPSIATVLDSRDALSPVSEASTSTGQQRVSFLKTLRQRRASNHIASYLRITACISAVQSFPVTVRRSDTIEDLARQIEAEYAFRYSASQHSSPALQPQVSVPESEGENGDTLSARGVGHSAPPLICGSLLLNDNPLPFDGLVGDALAMKDIVQVVNLYDEEVGPAEGHVDESSLSLAPNEPGLSHDTEPVLSPTSAHATHDDMSSLGSDTPPSPTSVMAALHQAPAVQQPLPSTRGASPHKSQSLFTMDRMSRLALPQTRFRNLLSSATMGPYFLHYCLQAGEFAVESALFWLDVERFRLTESNVCRLMANYIYITYLAPQAPLAVNISSELRNELGWPFLPGWALNVHVFDEAQEWVFQTMKLRMFKRFEMSDMYSEMWQDKRFTPHRYIQDRPSTLDDRGAWCPVNIDVVLWINNLNFNHEDRPLVTELSRLTDHFREELLSRVLIQFQPLSSSLKVTTGYFTNPQRITALQKHLRIQRSKRLLKFFGDQPDRDVLSQQLEVPMNAQTLTRLRWQQQQRSERMGRQGTSTRAIGQSEACANYRRRASQCSNFSSLLGVDSVALAVQSPTFSDTASLAPSMNSSVMGDPQWDTYTRKKKLEKLTEFFGDQIPEHVLVDQQLIDGHDELDVADHGAASDSPPLGRVGCASGLRDSSSADKSIQLPPLATNNELSLEQKRVLTKRRKKLKYMLGEPLAEATVEHTVTAPYIRHALGRRRSYTTSDVESTEARSPRSPFTPIHEVFTDESVEGEEPDTAIYTLSPASLLSPRPSQGSDHLRSLSPMPVTSKAKHLRGSSDQAWQAPLSQRRGRRHLDLDLPATGSSTRHSAAAGGKVGHHPMDKSARSEPVDEATHLLQSARLDANESGRPLSDPMLALHGSPSLPNLHHYHGEVVNPPNVFDLPGHQLRNSVDSPTSASLQATLNTSLASTLPGQTTPVMADTESVMSVMSLPPDQRERNIRRRQFEKLRDVLGPNLPFDTITTGAATRTSQTIGNEVWPDGTLPSAAFDHDARIRGSMNSGKRGGSSSGYKNGHVSLMGLRASKAASFFPHRHHHSSK
ncbi:hypothetical protein H4R34_001987 [Dimargaris verticillata]|uniref:RGS domain-containing protein n=1 Tax=Dimargaris verticillata TaxID=2761393 RepID=A0A9W8B521_9FUNG|nr:hypothetical protein H4R34_001987 [Dimargaris verticillata]